MTTTHFLDTAAGRCRSARAAASLLTLLLLFASGCDGLGGASESDYLERAEKHMQTENYRAAIIEYRNALGLEDRPETRAALGRAFLEDRQYENALTQLQRAHRQTAAEGLVLPLARVLFQLERLGEIPALPHPQGLRDREAAELSSYRALAYLHAGEVETARTLLDEGRRQAPELALHSLVEARLAFHQGDAEGAARAARTAIDGDADLAPAWSLLGDLARRQGDSEAALQAYDRALKLRPTQIAERLNRGLVLVALDRLDLVAADARFLRQNATDHPGGHFLQGLVHFQKGELDNALPYFQAALSAHRNYRPAMPYLAAIQLEQGNHFQAQQQLQRHAALGDGTIMSYRLWARLHMEQGDPEAARARLEGALQQHPEMASALGDMLAAIYLDSDQPERGVEFLRASLEQGQESPMMRHMLARALVEHGNGEGAHDLPIEHPAGERRRHALERLRQGEYTEALNLSREIIADAPGLALGHNVRGAALLGLERLNEARLAFQEGLKAVPDSISLAMNLGALEMQLGNRATAREVFENLQRKAPGHPASALRLAAIAIEDGEQGAAREWLKAAIENHPDQVQPHLMLARLHVAQDRPTDAVSALERALERHPEEPEVLFALADVRERLGAPNAALPLLRRLVELRSQEPEFHFRLARVAAATGDHRTSVEALRSVLELDSGHADAQRALVRQLGLSGDFDAAQKALTRLRDRQGDSAQLVAEDAWLLAREGRHEEASERYAAALDQEPVRQWMTERYRLLMQADRPEQALDHLATWLRDHPEDQAARHLLGSLQLTLGRNAEAAETYRNLLEQHADDVIALNNLSWLLREEATDEALEYARRAHDLAPGAPTVLHTLGVVLLYSDDSEAARAVLEEAYEGAGSAPDAGYHLAKARLAAGDHDAATALLREILASNAEFPSRDAAERMLRDLSD